jgi:putative transposase
MRTSRFSEEQIALALRQAEAGTAVKDICRKQAVSPATFYRWKKRFGSLGVSELWELRHLRDENRELKQLVADLSLDRVILQETLKKKILRPAEWRRVVVWDRAAYGLSERRACRVFVVARSSA